MSKRTRQQTIVDLVTRERIPSQAALADRLREAGFAVTQATLSRDIAELELVKTKRGYARPEDAGAAAGPQVPDAAGTLRRAVTKVTAARNLLVVRTTVGSAPAVALALDDGRHPRVLGTLAGDDTVLVIADDDDGAREVAEWLDEVIR